MNENIPENENLIEPGLSEEPVENLTVESLPETPALNEVGMDGLQESLSSIRERLDQVEASLEQLSQQASFLPGQIRLLAGKVEGMATSLSEPRYRSVLHGLLGIYDLLDQILRTLPAQDVEPQDHQRNYEVLRTQLRQILEANGLMEIPAAGAFDPELHRALKRVPTPNPSQAGQVLEVVRPGFRTEQAILRFAEVTVGAYQPQPSEPEDETNDQM
jgi:molecular chaperone GrpE